MKGKNEIPYYKMNLQNVCGCTLYKDNDDDLHWVMSQWFLCITELIDVLVHEQFSIVSHFPLWL